MRRVSDPDHIAAVATAVGVGLIALMITWLLGNRLIGLVLAAPAGPMVSLGLAIASGAVTSWLAARRLVAQTGR